MAAVWFRCLAEWRGRRRSWFALAMVVGIVCGAVLFSWAGARRTASAWDRLVEESNAHDAFVIGQQFDFDLEAVAGLPEVEDSAPVAYVGGATDRSEPFEMTPLVSVDGGFLGRIDRPKVLDGRRPDPAKADEIAITPPVAERTGLGVGDTLVLRPFTPGQFGLALSGGEPGPPEGPEVPLRIVGVEVSTNEGELLESVRSGDNIHLTPAFARTYADQVGYGPALAVRLRNGAADQSAFQRGVERIADGRPVQVTSQDDEGSKVQHSLHTQSLALGLFALFAGVVAAVAVAQALFRQAQAASGDDVTLRALGMTGRELWWATLLRAGVAGTAGGVLATGLAVVASPLMPLGLARTADPTPGLSVDGLAVAAGLLGVPILTVLLSAVPAWRLSRASRRGRVAGRSEARQDRLAGWGASPVATTGVRLALEPGRGGSAVSARSAVLGAVVSTAALTAALVFGASLRHVLATPRLYGWNWDVVVGNPFAGDLSNDVVDGLQASGPVAAFSAVAAAVIDVGGERTQAFGFETIEGRVLPPIVEGRAPERADELVVGTKVLENLDRDVGDRVGVRVGDTTAAYRIVGTGVFPQLSIFEVESLGRGALLTEQGLRRLVPEAQQNIFPVRWRAGVDRSGARRALQESFSESVQLSDAEAPLEIADFGQESGLPRILSGLVGLMGVVSLAHALGTTVRRRRRDVAILKTIGFLRRQIHGVVAWQATTVAVLALAAGLPLGLTAGRALWHRFAGDLGIVPQTVVPAAIALVVPVAIVLANLVAALPGRAAARMRPAQVLRTE